MKVWQAIFCVPFRRQAFISLDLVEFVVCIYVFYTHSHGLSFIVYRPQFTVLPFSILFNMAWPWFVLFCFVLFCSQPDSIYDRHCISSMIELAYDVYYLWTIKPFNRWTAWVFIIARTWLHNGRWRWTIWTWARALRAWAMTWAAATAATWTIASGCRWFCLWHHVDRHRLTMCIASRRPTSIYSRCTPISPGHDVFF